MVSYRGLYYPYIRFQDEAWLKAAAFYWDQLGRIVPYDDYELTDSDSVGRLRRADFVTEFSASGSEWRVGEAFEELLDRWGDALRQRYSIRDRNLVLEWRRGDFASPPHSRPGLDYVHVGKVRPSVRRALSDMDLAVAGDGPWLGMHPRLVAVYMTALAQTMAEEHGAVPLTDDVVDHIAIASPNMLGIAEALLPMAENPAQPDQRTNRDIEGAMANLAIESVLPKGLAEMPIDEVIDHRNRNANARAAFQAGLGELVENLSHLDGLPSVDFAWHLRNEHRKHVQGPLDQLREDLRDNRIDVVSGLLSTEFRMPAALAIGAGLLGITIAPPIGLGLGVAVAAWGAARQVHHKDRELERASWVAYLLKVEQAGSAERGATDVLHAAARIQGWPHA